MGDAIGTFFRVRNSAQFYGRQGWRRKDRDVRPSLAGGWRGRRGCGGVGLEEQAASPRGRGEGGTWDVGGADARGADCGQDGQDVECTLL